MTPRNWKPVAAIFKAKRPPPALPANVRPAPTAAAPVGLGDVVSAVAQPIARVIDAIAGTNLKNCPTCAQRKAALNKMIPRVIPKMDSGTK